MNNYILCVNAGSSSLKVTAVSSTDSITHQVDTITDYEAALKEVLSLFHTDISEFDTLVSAVGYRIVHGGPQESPARLIDDALIGEVEAYADFDPQHIPAALAIISILRKRFPDISHVACFDTAFFHNLPKIAQTIALPREFQALGVRRYGFHGLSYEYLLHKLLGSYPSVAHEKVILAHLGSGASLCAIDSKNPIDTTMGFTPASGIIMSSRLGDTDPTLVTFLHAKTGMSLDEWTRIVNQESGLRGISGSSGDMYNLLQQEDSNPRAKEAIDVFVYRIQKAIGELSAAMGGVDRLVFAGGIGEKSASVRERIVANLGYLGFTIEPSLNPPMPHGPEPDDVCIVNIARSKPIHVIHTDENQIIATHVRNILTQTEGEIR